MPGQLRILVTGSRTWTCADTIGRALAEAVGRYGSHLAEWNPDTDRMEIDWSAVTVVHGGANGADRIAARIAAGWGCRTERHDPNWPACADRCRPQHRKMNSAGQEYCPTAGHRRNAAMVARGADVCVAFVRDASRGATGCAGLAEKAGIPVVRHVETTEVAS